MPESLHLSSSRTVQRGRLRIIGGEWKRRQIRFSGGADLRPTPDSVRETVFNWLSPYLHQAKCLDLFAGSGALGLEAASRGAGNVALVEMHKHCCGQLKDNVALLGAKQVMIHCADALDWMTSCEEQFDIVFVDPPYDTELVKRSLNRLIRYRLLRPEARIYIECSAQEAPTISEEWAVLRQKKAGQVCYGLYQHSANAVDNKQSPTLGDLL